MDFYCGDLSVRVGGPASILNLSRTWMEAEALRAEELYGDYESARQTRAGSPANLLPGTRAFIEGLDELFWTPRQCGLMLDALEELAPFIERLSPTRFDHRGHYFLERLWRRSVRHFRDVQSF